MGAPESEPDGIMNSRVSWSVDGIDPSVRERAEAAARRAGMSVNDWLNSTLGDSTPPSYRDGAPLPSSTDQDVADIHQRERKETIFRIDTVSGQDRNRA